MKQKLVVLSVVGLLFTLGASLAMAQQSESRLVLIGEVHVKLGMVPQYEAAIKEAVAFRGENEFLFGVSAFVTEGLVYRYVTFLGSWEDMNTNDDWYEQFSSPPDFVERINEATDHFDDSFQRTRPELRTSIDNPRVRLGEAGFIHEVRLHLRPGADAEMAEVLKKFSALYTQHDIRDGRIVWSQVSGSDGPVFALYFPASDAANYYTHRQQNVEMMGAEYQSLLGELSALSRQIEQLNWTIRRDLSYQPAN